MEALQKGLEKLTAEDPNLKATVDKETGEYLLSGMGELHLEVAINELKGEGWSLAVSSPRVVYMEAQQRTAQLHWLRAPISKAASGYRLNPNRNTAPTWMKTEACVLSFDEHRNALVDYNRKTEAAIRGGVCRQ